MSVVDTTATTNHKATAATNGKATAKTRANGNDND